MGKDLLPVGEGRGLGGLGRGGGVRERGLGVVTEVRYEKR